MALTSERELRQLLTASVVYRQKKIEDLVFNSNPITALLRQRGAYKPYYGAEIRVPVQFDKLGAQWYTGYDKLEIAAKELVNSAVFRPKHTTSLFSLSGSELLANRGRGEIIDLLEFYLNSAENSLRDEVEIALHSDGTGSGGKSMIGFGGALPIVNNAGTYGGISRTDHAVWRTSTFSVPGGNFSDIGTTWDATTARPIIERIAAMRSKGNQYADVLVCDVKSYQAISASLVAHQRLRSERMGALGFEALSIWTPAGMVDIVCASGVGTVMPDNTIYGLDMSSLALYYHPDENFVPFHEGEGARPINQNAIAQGIKATMELVLSNPRYSYRLITA